MDKKRERGDNWSQEDKDLLVQIMRESGAIIDNKKTDTETNKRKTLEWINVQRKFYVLAGKKRKVAQLKGAWRRHKRLAKSEDRNPILAVKSKNILQSNSDKDCDWNSDSDTADLLKEQNLKIKYQKQELRQQELRHKLEIELLMMEKEKKALEIQLLKDKVLDLL